LNAARSYENEFFWLAFFDTDEFLVLESGLQLRELLLMRLDCASVVVPWALFGSSGHRNRPPGFVIENYLYRSKNDFPPNRHIKTIARPERIISFENPHMAIMDGAISTLSGDMVSFERHGVLQFAPDYKFGKLHHYFTRSWEDWLLKISRGYNGVSRDISEFQMYDLNDIYDDSATEFIPLVQNIIQSS
jgi:hypothetical protein